MHAPGDEPDDHVDDIENKSASKNRCLRERAGVRDPSLTGWRRNQTERFGAASEALHQLTPRLAVHHSHFQARGPRPTSTTLRRIARAHRGRIHRICATSGVFVTNSMGKLEDFFRAPAVTTIKLIAMRERTKRSPIRRPNTRNEKVSLLAGKQQSARASSSRQRTNPSPSEGATRIALHVLAACHRVPSPSDAAAERR
jgi:hypothetical protein